MKVLILSCGTGEGHNSAAQAIGEALKKRGIDYVLADPIAFGSEKAKGFVTASYNNMIKKIPAAFGALYKAGDLYSSTKLISPVYFANSLYAGNLKNYITENNFDRVICTHLFAMEAMTAVRNKTNCHIPCYGVLTDYTCVPFFAETKMDGYFIPDEAIQKELIDKKIPSEKVISSGIPVSAKFKAHIDKDAARNYLVIPQSKAVFLIMSGGVGCGNILELCDELINRNETNYVAYILVGRNSELKEKIDVRYANHPQIQAVTFTEKVNLYMNAADVLISKPGGLSSTEAAVANVPLVHMLAFSGCESKNLAFFKAREMSVGAANSKEAIVAAWELIHDEEKSERMRTMQRKYIKTDAAEQIVSRITES